MSGRGYAEHEAQSQTDQSIAQRAAVRYGWVGRAAGFTTVSSVSTTDGSWSSFDSCVGQDLGVDVGDGLGRLGVLAVTVIVRNGSFPLARRCDRGGVSSDIRGPGKLVGGLLGRGDHRIGRGDLREQDRPLLGELTAGDLVDCAQRGGTGNEQSGGGLIALVLESGGAKSRAGAHEHGKDDDPPPASEQSEVADQIHNAPTAEFMCCPDDRRRSSVSVRAFQLPSVMGS